MSDFLHNRIFKWLEIYTKPVIIRIWFFGFASGLTLLLSGNTLNFWLAHEGIDTRTVGLFSLVALPYAFKFMLALVIDNIEIPYLSKKLGNRKSWILISQVFLVLMLILTAYTDPLNQIYRVAILGFLIALCAVIQDVALDAYRVNIIKDIDKGPASAMHICGYRIGMLCSGGGAIYFSSILPWKVIYLFMAGLIAITSFIILKYCQNNEELIENNQEIVIEKNSVNSKNFFKKIIAILFDVKLTKNNINQIVIVLLFVTLYRISDNFITVMANPFLLSLGYKANEIASAAKIFGFIATIIGTFFGGVIIPKISIRRALFIFGAIHLLTHLLFIIQVEIGYNIKFLYFLTAAENITAGMAMSAYITYITLLSKGKYAGTQYSLYSSFMGLSRVVIPSISGILANELNWFGFFIFVFVVGIPPLILILFIKDKINKNN